MTISEIKENYKEHHTSWARHYVSRKRPDGIAVEYNGRFGKGYKIYTPSWVTSQYCYVTYYIAKR